MDKEVVEKPYDVILHCGLLYHMKNIEKIWKVVCRTVTSLY
jgi:hypothetical protein